MAVNSFVENAQYAEKHIQHIVLFYRHRFGQAVYLSGSQCTMAIQRAFHVDIAVGEWDCHITEVKTVEQRDPPMRRMYLEHLSCSLVGHQTLGWIVASRADTLTYAYVLKDGSSDTYIVDMPRLQSFFKGSDKHRWEAHVNPSQNQSSGYLVPINEIRGAIADMQRYRILTDGTFYQIW